MPTANPRINVTIPPSLDATVSRLSALTRTSKSQVLRELLEAAEPALQRAVTLMEAAQTAAAAVKHSLARDLDAAQTQAEREAASILAKLDGAAADLVAQAEAVRERRPRSASRARAAAPHPVATPQDPPASNRGVKSTRRAVK